MVKNIEASVKTKLLHIARNSKSNISFDYILLRYMQEKLLERLVNSKYSSNFILKGGLMFLIYKNDNPRVTKDIDFLGDKIDNSATKILDVFKEILGIELNDALIFDIESIKSETIKEDADYEGIRIVVTCYLGKAKKNLQIDIGYGDDIYPGIQYTKFPSLLGNDIENVAVYSKETIIAEKFEAMIKLSLLNSRMKDFYDIYTLINNNNFVGEDVKTAIIRTFKNRYTNLENNPLIFREDFYKDSTKLSQWKAFIKQSKLENIEFEKIISEIKEFLTEIIESIMNKNVIRKNWDFKMKKWID